MIRTKNVTDFSPVQASRGRTHRQSLHTSELYLPYAFQHEVLLDVQRILEECFYDFTMTESPQLIREWSLDSAVCAELSFWPEEVLVGSTALSEKPDQPYSNSIAAILPDTSEGRKTGRIQRMVESSYLGWRMLVYDDRILFKPRIAQDLSLRLNRFQDT